MSLEKIEEYLKDVQAIKFYDTIKAQNERLIEQNKKIEETSQIERNKLMEINSELTLERDNLSQEIIDLRAEVDQKDSRINNLTTNLVSSREEASKLKERVKELEDLKATVEGKTLKEAAEIFIKAKKEEIQKEALESSNLMKAEWTLSEKPTEVRNEAIRILNHIIASLKITGYRPEMTDLAGKGLYDDVEAIIKSDVDKRLDEEFEKRVEQTSTQRTAQKFNQLVSTEWPDFLRTHLEPKARELELKVKSNVLSLLQGTWPTECERCGMKGSLTLPIEGVEYLLRNGSIKTNCPNHQCHHQTPLKLIDLIKLKLSPSY